MHKIKFNKFQYTANEDKECVRKRNTNAEDIICQNYYCAHRTDWHSYFF